MKIFGTIYIVCASLIVFMVLSLLLIELRGVRCVWGNPFLELGRFSSGMEVLIWQYLCGVVGYFLWVWMAVAAVLSFMVVAGKKVVVKRVDWVLITLGIMVVLSLVFPVTLYVWSLIRFG